MQNAPAFDGIESQALRRQQTAFCVLSLMVLAVLLVLHTWFAALLGNPSSSVILLLCCSFAAKSVEWYWLWRRRDGISLRTAKLETVISILGLFVLAGLLAVFTDRDEAPYFVLLAIAILRCAYLFSLMQTLLTIGAAIAMMFGWAHHFFVLHPPSRPTEFLETGMVSVIYSVMGLVVWYLVNQLGSKQAKLVEKMSELEVARERLAREEKLAAVGRLASGIAHEIRNPVAMIASSLATARFPNADAEEREEMFAIAAREAKRLENLTSEFLTYARPSSPQRMPVRVSEVLDHVVHITRIQASEASIGVAYEPCGDRMASIDPFQVEGALVNLAINAIAATPPEGRIRIGTRSDSERIIFEIENSGEKIRDNDLKRVFEPFFTTKHGGTGLGLAIAKGVARSHGGDLWVSKNLDGAVEFSMSLDIGG